MPFELQSLLDLRRDAEIEAQRALAVASAKLREEEEEQTRRSRRWQAARATLDAEARRLAEGTAASTGEQALARERYLRRLRDEAHALEARAAEHATTALAAARSSHDQAARKYQTASQDLEAASKLAERTKEAAQKATTRQADAEATDRPSTRAR